MKQDYISRRGTKWGVYISVPPLCCCLRCPKTSSSLLNQDKEAGSENLYGLLPVGINLLNEMQQYMITRLAQTMLRFRPHQINHYFLVHRPCYDEIHELWKLLEGHFVALPSPSQLVHLSAFQMHMAVMTF